MYELGGSAVISAGAAHFRDEVATAELYGAAGGGGWAVARDDDADEVGRIGSGRHCAAVDWVVEIRCFAGFAQGFDGLRQRELFALEAGDEAAAAHDAAGFEAAEHAEQLAPAGHGGFALHEIAEDDAVAPEEDESGGFYLLFSLLGCGDGGGGLQVLRFIEDDRWIAVAAGRGGSSGRRCCGRA